MFSYSAVDPVLPSITIQMPNFRACQWFSSVACMSSGRSRAIWLKIGAFHLQNRHDPVERFWTDLHGFLKVWVGFAKPPAEVKELQPEQLGPRRKSRVRNSDTAPQLPSLLPLE